jgi:hypothetical protein
MARRLSNLQVVNNDIEKDQGYAFSCRDTIIGYTAVIINDYEPAYEIEGKWLTTDDFVVIHREWQFQNIG